MVKPNPDRQTTERGLAQLADEELVTSHLAGRPGAFQELYDRYRDRLIHFITRKTGDPDRAQDLVQAQRLRREGAIARGDEEGLHASTLGVRRRRDVVRGQRVRLAELELRRERGARR